jgi:hypothetical protein
MSIVQISRSRPDAAVIGTAFISTPSLGVSRTSKFITEMLADFARPTPTFSGSRTATPKSLQEQLYEALAAFKIRTATVAMHLDREWRSRLFAQFDSLLATENWEVEDSPPSLDSFSTFLRMLVLLQPDRRPGLGATHDGVLIAAWTSGDDRLTIECLPKDVVRWHLSVTIDGERERAAAIMPLQRLSSVLLPYSPQRWFNYADNISPG